MNVFDLVARIVLDTDDYRRSLEQAGSDTNAFGDKLKNGLSKVAKVGAAGMAAATAAVTAFGGSAIKAGSEFDSSMSQVAATMGTTVDEIGNLRDFAMEMGAKTAFSARQAADALNYMALAGYDAEESMQALPNVLNLAAAGGIELAAASDMVTDAQSALGLSMEESAELVDKMAMASSKSNTSVAQLGEAILTVGGTAKTLAGGTTELSTALGILADNGVKGAEGGTALRNIILSLSAPTDTAAAAMKSLGLEVFDAEGNMRPLNETFGDLNTALSAMTQGEQTKVLNEVFNKVDLKSVNALLSNTVSGIDNISAALESSGVEWGKYRDRAWAAGDMSGLIADLEYNISEIGTSAEELQQYLQFEYDLDAEDAMAVIGSLTSRWDELSGYIDNATGSAENMAATQLDNLTGDVTLLKSAVEGVQIAFSDKLSPALREGTQFLTDLAGKAQEFIENGGIEKLVQGFLNLVPAITGATSAVVAYKSAMAISSLVDAATRTVRAYQAANEGATVAQALLNTTILKNPFALIVSAIAAVVAALVTLYMTNEDFRNKVQEIWGNIKEIFSGAWESIKETWDTVKPYFLEIWDGIKTAFNGAAEFLGGVFSAAWSVIQKVWGPVSGYFQNIWNTIAGIFSAVEAVLSGDFSAAWESIKGVLAGWGEYFSGLWDTVKDIFSGAKDWFFDVGKNVLEGIWNGINDKVEWLKGKVTGVVDTIKGWFTGKEGFDEHSPSKWSNQVFRYVMDGGGNGLEEGLPSLMSNVSNVVNKVKGGMDFGTANVGFASSAVGQSSAAIINSVAGGDAGVGQPLVVNLQLPDGTNFATWQLPYLIKVASANGTPIAGQQYA